MQGIYTYIPETNCVPREYSVVAIVLLLYYYYHHHHHHLLYAGYLQLSTVLLT